MRISIEIFVEVNYCSPIVIDGLKCALSVYFEVPLFQGLVQCAQSYRDLEPRTLFWSWIELVLTPISTRIDLLRGTNTICLNMQTSLDEIFNTKGLVMDMALAQGSQTHYEFIPFSVNWYMFEKNLDTVRHLWLAFSATVFVFMLAISKTRQCSQLFRIIW